MTSKEALLLRERPGGRDLVGRNVHAGDGGTPLGKRAGEHARPRSQIQYPLPRPADPKRGQHFVERLRVAGTIGGVVLGGLAPVELALVVDVRLFHCCYFSFIDRSSQRRTR